jgi:predicted DNA-binding protein (UPF0251 family)
MIITDFPVSEENIRLSEAHLNNLRDQLNGTLKTSVSKATLQKMIAHAEAKLADLRETHAALGEPEEL